MTKSSNYGTVAFVSFLVLVLLLCLIVMDTAQAGGYANVGIQYNSGGAVVQGGSPVIIHQYPNGRVVVEQVPVTHVYPNGESLIYQNGGDRVYSQGYGGAGTCYVDCWHNGVRPGGTANSGINVSVGVNVNKTW
jgi:hypothetical protein